MKNKRKVIFIIVLSIILLNCSTILGKEKATTLQNNIVNSEKYQIEFNIDNMDYYPFIYSKKNKWEIDNIIGESECEEGYLYSKDLRTNIIRKLINVKIDKFSEADNKIYFIYDNCIYSVDYLGESINEIYKSSITLMNNVLLFDNNKLYFSENNFMCCIDLTTGEINKVTCNKAIDNIYKDTDNNILINSENTIYKFSDESYLTSYDIGSNSMRNNNVGISSVPSSEQLDTNLIAIFNDYPSGSYFTNDGGPCGHHGTGSCSYWGNCNCKAYSGTIQCVALAKYASDRYAHKSDWNPSSADIIETDIQFTSESQVIAFFSSIQTGAYIRLSYYSEAQYEQSGFHSMFFVKYDNNFITTYECNLAGNCNVRILRRTPSEFLSDYRNVWGIYRVSHKFSNGPCLSYDTEYHKIYCSRGCGGYIYEAHYNRNNMGAATCEVCGYTGTIEYTKKLELGKYN